MADFKAGDHINNRYEIVRKLGAGAMGSVYQALDLVESKIQVALKVLISETLEDQDVWAKGEYEALTRLRHPNLARVYDFGRVQGTPDYYIVSEFIKGTDLYSATEYSSYEELCDIIVQICRSLEYIHSQGYVHFDIKPDNILVTRHRCATMREGSKVQWVAEEGAPDDGTPTKPNVKLIDFGLAEKITGSFDFAIKGTLHYLAPEMINGGTPDRRADLYSLGVTLYQIANRDLPFHHDANAYGRSLKRSELFEIHMKKLPEFLRNVLLKLLAERPEERFQSAREVIEAISAGSGKHYELETRETQSSYLHTAALIGRQGEFGQLKELSRAVFLQVRSRMGDGVVVGTRPPLILVSGEIGSGKSRLVEEFRHFLRLNYVQVYAGNCYDGQSSAYQPFVEILKQLAIYLGRDHAVFARHRDALLRLLPEFRTPSDTERPLGMRPDQEKLYFIDRIVRFLLEAAREQPYALVINNLHWADEMTVELLGYFLQNLVEEEAQNEGQSLGLLVLATFRTDEKIPAYLRQLLALLREEKRCEEILLRRFKRNRVQDLISATLLMTTIPEDFIACIAEKTGGNPLFIVETLKALQESGAIRQGASGWEIAAKDFRKIDIPPSVEMTLIRRIENLESLGREIIEILAVANRPIPTALLQSWPRLDRAPILQHLRELEEKGLIVSALREGEELFGIDQPSLGETIYAHLKPERRQQLHGEFAELLREAYASRADEVLEELAHHYRHSGNMERALDLALQAGERLKRIYANEKAYEYFAFAAQALAERGPENPLWVSTQESLADLCLLLGRYDEAARLCTMLLSPEVANAVSAATVSRFHRQRGKVFEIQGDYEQALPCYKEARELLDMAGATDEAARLEMIWAINALGGLYVKLGKYDKAMKISIEALRIIEDSNETVEHAVVFATIGKANFLKGNLSQAIEFHRRSLDIEEKLGDSREMIHTLNNLGESYQANAEYASAYECFQRAVALSEEVGDSYGRALSLYGLGCFYVAVGAVDKADEAQQASLRLSRAYHMRQLTQANYALQGMILQERGDLTKAEASLFRALTASAKQGNRWELCTLLIRVAELHRRTGNVDEATRVGQDALRLSLDLEIDQLKFHCHLFRGRLLWANGKYDEARAAFDEANALLPNIGNPELTAEICAEMGEAMARSRRTDEARGLWERMLEAAQKVLEHVPPEFRDCFRARHPSWYRGTIDELAALARPEEGHAVAAPPPPEQDHGTRLALLTQLTGDLAMGKPAEEVLRDALRAVTRETGAEHGFLLRVEGTENVRVILSCGRDGAPVSKPSTHIVAELIGQVLSDGKPILCTDTRSHPATSSLASVFERSIAAVVVMPLRIGAAIDGILFLANPDVRLGQRDLASILASFVPIFMMAMRQHVTAPPVPAVRA